MHDAAIDLVVSIFAPKNFAPRVLRPVDELAIAYPGSDHLIELPDRFGLLRHDEETPRRYPDMTTPLTDCPAP